MKNNPNNSHIETRRDGFFVDTLLDSDPETPFVKAETFIDDLLEVLAPDGCITTDIAIDAYSCMSESRELENFSTEEKERMLGNRIEEY